MQSIQSIAIDRELILPSEHDQNSNYNKLSLLQKKRQNQVSTNEQRDAQNLTVMSSAAVGVPPP